MVILRVIFMFILIRKHLTISDFKIILHQTIADHKPECVGPGHYSYHTCNTHKVVHMITERLTKYGHVENVYQCHIH
jgi:hypothetical protein